MSIHYGHDILFPEDHKHYTTVFDINLLKAEITDDSRVIKVRDGDYSLHQKDVAKSPVPGPGFIRNRKSCFMLFKCPEMVNINISVFVVVSVNKLPINNEWSYIIGNDNGSYDKFIGYKSNTTNQLTYGGGFPIKEYNCTIQSGVNIFEKHLISCHWLLDGSCVYINGVKSPDSDFDANPKSIGETCGSIFLNYRFIGTTGPMSTPFVGKIFAIKIISGFLEPSDITHINSEMMINHEVKQ